MTCKKEYIQKIDFNITKVARDGTLNIQKGETEYGEGELRVDHMVTPAKDKYWSLEKEPEGEGYFSN